MYNKFLVNSVLWAFFPIMSHGYRPTQDGVNWITNIDEERESTGSRKYEDPISVKKTPKKVINFNDSRQDDTLTMHTMDMMSNLKQSVIHSSFKQSFLDVTPVKPIKNDNGLRVTPNSVNR